MRSEFESTQLSDKLSGLFENYDSDWSVMTSYVNINTAQTNEISLWHIIGTDDSIEPWISKKGDEFAAARKGFACKPRVET